MDRGEDQPATLQIPREKRSCYGHGAKPLEDFKFQIERAVAGIGDLGLDLAEF